VKKILFYSLITVAILWIFLGPLKAEAAVTCVNTTNGGLTNYRDRDTCPPGTAVFTGYVTGQSVSKEANSVTECDIGLSNIGDIFSAACLLRAAAGFSFIAIYSPAKLIFTAAGYAMDASIDISINKFSDFATTGGVAKGWSLARDIVNLLLIFILLYIAIATILQVSGYGAKELLLTLIIIAFLVNFSLVITKLIIDASNVLAVEFYRPFGTTGISETFRNAFDADSVINVKAFSGKNLYFIELITYLLGGVIFLIASFIFFTFSILFLTRMVVLLILMIFAPLAFAAHVLPSTKKHASSWWSYLFNQTFFAPAALFLLYLSAGVANSGFIKDVLGLGKLGDKGMADLMNAAAGAGADKLSLNWDDILKFILQFFIIAILLIASLVIAKQMGAIGAQTAMAGGKKMSKKLQGYAGRVTARTAIGRPARAFTESGIGRAIGRSRIPMAGALYRGAEGLAKAGKLEEVTQRKAESQARLGLSLGDKERENYFGKLRVRSQETMFNKLSDKQRAAMANINPNAFDSMFKYLEPKIGHEKVVEMKANMGNNMATPQDRFNFFQKQDPDIQRKMFETASARDRVALLKGLPLAIQTALMDGLSLEEKDKTVKAGKEVERKEVIKNLTKAGTALQDFITGLKALKPDEIKDLDEKEMVAAMTNPIGNLGVFKTNEMINNLSSAHLGKIIDRGDKITDLFLDELTKIGKAAGGRIDDLVADLQLRNNFSLAGKINDPVVKSQLQALGLK
jgi:hypothetical protein